jgi:hypothetical protein
MQHARSPFPSAPLALALAVVAAVCGAACSQGAAAAVYPATDLRPPGLLEAGPVDAGCFRARFDEAVSPVEGSFRAEPEASLSARAEGQELLISFASAQSPGAEYALAGEVDDLAGNRTRFLLRFTGWNDRAPRLRISELQTGKNTAKTRPHRDYVELEVLADGNIGGEELCWTSTVKAASYRFPAVEVRRGDFLVLHLAPEGILEERDELGSDLAASGGIDSSPEGRDLWCAAAPLPDESGALSLAPRPGGEPTEGFFYAIEGKAGPLADGPLADLVARLAAAGAWSVAGTTPAWEDAFKWKASTARSLCRWGTGAGAAGWYVSEAGAQTPGLPNSGPGAVPSLASTAKKLPRKLAAKKP